MAGDGTGVEDDRQPPAVETAAELRGQLFHELSLLVRADLQLGAARRSPQIHEAAREVAVAAGVASASMLALASVSVAVGLVLAAALSSWAAALVVAAGWAIAAAVLLRLEHPRRLVRRLTQATDESAVASAERARVAAEQAVRTTARRLAHAAAHEAAEREISAAERELELLLGALVDALLAPGRLGISLLARVGGKRATAERADARSAAAHDA